MNIQSESITVSSLCAIVKVVQALKKSWGFSVNCITFYYENVAKVNENQLKSSVPRKRTFEFGADDPLDSAVCWGCI